MRCAIALLSLTACIWGQPPRFSEGRTPRRANDRPAVAQEGSGRIGGAVTQRRTGEPVPRAIVHLQSTSGAEGISVQADAGGRFLFEGVPRGVYRVSAERRGFLTGRFGTRRAGQSGGLVTLGDGGEFNGADIKMDAQSVIAGQVLDEYGEPMERAVVQAWSRAGAPGERGRAPVNIATTDDRGEFRIAGLAPGRYFVQASAGRRGFQTRNVRRAVQAGEAGKDIEESYVPTYFPGTTDAKAATPVELGIGQEFLGLSLQMQKSRVFRVRGTVTGTESRGLRVMAAPRGGGSFASVAMSAGIQPDGGFELSGLAPGSYTLTAARGGPGTGAMARATVEVGNADVTGVLLAFGNTFKVAGTVKVEGAAAAGLGNLRVQLTNEEAWYLSPSGRVNADGSFTIEGVPPDRYRFSATFLPPGLYVKSARMGNQDVTAAALDFTSGAAGRIDVVLGSQPAAAAGTVGKATTEALPGVVVLVPDSRMTESPGAAAVQQRWEAAVDQNGAFRIENVPPGEYRIFAFEEFDPASGYDPEFLKKFESASQKAAFGEGETKTFSLKQIPGGELAP